MGIQHDQMAHAATSRLLADIRGGYVEWRAASDAGRLLVLSPFDPAITRTTGAQAQARNEFIAALCHAVLIPHAAPGGKAEAIAANRGRRPATVHV